MARQISSMKVDERRRAVGAFVGQRVTISFRRGWHEPLTGRVVAVAVSFSNVADVLVIDSRGPGYYPLSISLAEIRTITREGAVPLVEMPVESCGCPSQVVADEGHQPGCDLADDVTKGG